MENIPRNVNDLEDILKNIMSEEVTLREDEVRQANENLKSVSN